MQAAPAARALAGARADSGHELDRSSRGEHERALERRARVRRHMTEPVLVGLDVGTSGVKALALSATGEIVARAEHGYPLATPQPGWAEQDPEDWWTAAQAALAELRV